MTRAASLALIALAVLACSPNPDRQRWQWMPAKEKQMYVSSLLGHERAKEAKGGNDRVFDRGPADYVQEIDAAYGRGDRRSPAEIFESLGRRK